MKIKDLKPAEYNPRKITDEKLQMLKKALEEFGDLSGIVFNRQTGNLIGGHQRLKCLPPDAKIEKIKLKKPSRTGTVAEGRITIDGENYSYREVDWPVEKEKAANIAANQQGGEFDDELLSTLIKELSEIPDFDTDLTGFDDKEISGILSSIAGEGLTDPDEVPDVPTQPHTKPGDLYILGKHRLLCGDATKKEDVEGLMDGKKADMVFTDPPYGANITGINQSTHASKWINRTKRWEQIKGDENEDADLQAFLEKAFKNFSVCAKDNAAWYIWHAMLTQGFFAAAAAAAAALLLHRQIIWVKPTLILAFGHFHWRHELCFYGWKRGFEPDFFGPTNETTVWDIDFDGKGRMPNEERKHPTQKPTALAERAISNSAMLSHIILDGFLGSGSTLIACEKTGRICYGMEIDPHYCDVIVTRYCKFTSNNKITKNGKEITWQA